MKIVEGEVSSQARSLIGRWGDRAEGNVVEGKGRDPPAASKSQRSGTHVGLVLM